MTTISGAHVAASECHWFTRDNGETIRKGPHILYASIRESWYRKPIDWIVFLDFEDEKKDNT